MCKTLPTLLATFIIFFATPVKLPAFEPSEETAMASTTANEVLVLEEIQVMASSQGGGGHDDQSVCSNQLPTQLPVGTIELSMECKRNESWGSVEAGQTIKFSYPLQISPDAPGEFIADAFGGFLWNVGYWGGSAMLALDAVGEWGDLSPDCQEKKFEYATGGGDLTVNKSIHLNAKCNYGDKWWVSDDATFQFNVYTKFDRNVCKPTCHYVNEISQFFRVILKYKKGSAGPFVLSISRTGSGAGTVTSSPAGINCGADCSQSYSSGTSVSLTAKPDSDSTFTGWVGGDCAGTGTCTVTMDKPIVVAANFLNINIKKPVPIAAINVLLLWEEANQPGNNCWRGGNFVPGKVDCAGECIDIAVINQLSGDGICDAGIRVGDLYCDTFGMDGGDCEGTVPGKPCGANRVLNCALECVDKTLALQFSKDNICDPELNCDAFLNDKGVCQPGATCGNGITVDCLSQCVDEAALLERREDEICNDELNCAAFNYDEGDCGCF